MIDTEKAFRYEMRLANLLPKTKQKNKEYIRQNKAENKEKRKKK